MISIAQFKKEIVEMTYPSEEEIIIKENSASAADWCLDFLKEEGLIVVVKEEMYICIDLRDVFDSALNDLDWDDADDTLKAELGLFPIFGSCRNEMGRKHNDEVMAILYWFDKFCGYDSTFGVGIVGFTFEDLKKHYNLYREKVSDKDIPVFEEQIRKIFKEKTDRFLKIMGYEQKAIPQLGDLNHISCTTCNELGVVCNGHFKQTPHLWETSGPVLKGTRGGGYAVGSISEIKTEGMKLLYWSWKRFEEYGDEFYNRISLSFIDLAREGSVFEISVNFDDREKENEEMLLKDLIKRTAINLLSE